jgi:acyl-CoA thioesterase FadM
MYPYIRIAKELWKFRRSPRLSILEPHISTHRVWPWDLDPWRELNNGRTLTLFDLGRIPMSVRMGFDRVAEAKGWGITVAGNSTRYRRRVTVFQKLTQVSRVLGWDARFVYLEQSFWRDGECTASMLLR